MKFDTVVISEDKILINALRHEFSLLGCSCGSSTSDISEDSVVIFDASSGYTCPNTDNEMIYILPTDMSVTVGGEYTVFTKPFLVEELVLAVMRLRFGSANGTQRDRGFSVTVSDTFIIIGGKRIDLTKNEMLIFKALWNNKGNAVGREHLDMITRANSNGNMVTVYINRLREKISNVTEKKIIVTVRDKGYMIPEL